MPPFLRDLPDGLIEYLSWRRRRVEKCDIGAVLWSLSTVDASHRHHLVIGLRLFATRETWRGLEEKLTSTGDAERSYVLPLKRDSDRDSIYDRTTRGGLAFYCD